MTEQLRDELPTYKGLRAPLFLFRQPFLVWPGTLATIGAWFWLVTTMIQHGKGSPAGLATMVLVGPLVGFGFAVLFFLPGFMVWRWLRAPTPALVLEPGEALLLTRSANHWLGDEARGGKLHLTTRGLVFVPHRFNVQLGGGRWPWADVLGTKWFRIVTPQGAKMSMVMIVSRPGGAEWFVLDHAGKLAELVEALAPLDDDARAARGLDLARAQGLAPPA